MNGNDPVIISGISIASVILFVKATLTLVQAMGWLILDEEQWAVLSNYAETVIPILAVGIGTWWASRNTTNLANPKDIDGTPLSRPEDVPAIKKMESLHSEAIRMDDKIEQTRGFN